MLKRAIFCLLFMPAIYLAPSLARSADAPQVRLEAHIPQTPGVTADAQRLLMQQCTAILRKRLESSGVANPALRLVGNDRIWIEFPPPNDLKRLIGILAKPGHLELKLVDDSVAEPDLKDWVKKAHAAAGLDGAFVKEAKVAVDQNQPYVSLTLTPDAGAALADLTGKNVGKRLAIVYDGDVILVPMIRDRIPNGKAQIMFGNGDFQDLLRQSEDLVIVLNSGSLPSKITLRELKPSP